MKWAYAIRNKIAASLLLFVVLGVVILNNTVERRNSKEIQQSITTIYDDRLVVEEYIYQYAERLHEIAEFTLTHQKDERASISVLTGALAEINSLHVMYEKTRLTKKERAVYSDFRNTLKEMEDNLAGGNFPSARDKTRKGLTLLKELSAIQVAQGKIEIEKATKNYSSSSVLFNFEVAVVFIILLIIQGLIFASKTVRETTNRSSLN